jgi:hypothetical protein
LSTALGGIKLGVTFLTPENINAPWILYEAGSLAKTIDDSTRLCTYLLGGLTHEQVKLPLGQFQHTLPEKDDTRHLVQTINKAVGEDDPLPEKTLNEIFDRFWPVLEEKIKLVPKAPAGLAPKRSVEDMLAEVLDFTRSEINRRQLPNNVYGGVVGLKGSIKASLPSYADRFLIGAENPPGSPDLDAKKRK